MVTKKSKGLGRGLEALLGPSLGGTSQEDSPRTEAPSTLLITDMVAGQYQPRTRMDEGALYELAESIKAQGIMQPILVRQLSAADAKTKREALVQHDPTQHSSNTLERPLYEIIAGERRFRAAKLAGLTQVPVLVRDVPNEAAAAMALIENIQRENLNPLEEAQGLSRLVREFGLSHEAAAQAVGKSRSTASNLLRLLNLTPAVQDMLMAGDLDMGHARALLSLDKGAQVTAATQIASKKLSVRQAEGLAKKIGAEFNLTAPTKPRAATKGGDWQRLEEELSDKLATTVEFRLKKMSKSHTNRHNLSAANTVQSGELVIHFSDLDNLNGLIEQIRRIA